MSRRMNRLLVEVLPQQVGILFYLLEISFHQLLRGINVFENFFFCLASIGSAGYGAMGNAISNTQRIEEYPYMTSLYPAMNGKKIVFNRNFNSKLSYNFFKFNHGHCVSFFFSFHSLQTYYCHNSILQDTNVSYQYYFLFAFTMSFKMLQFFY